MKLTYIHHSCYLIELPEHNILIDFYEDTKSVKSGEIHERILHESKTLYVLSSHHHHDHFNPSILDWKKSYKGELKYIFSSDIKNLNLADNQDILFLEKGDVFKDGKIYLKAFGSTDEGISFLIKTDSLSIFHAGDLNNWHWREECPPEESKTYEDNYLKELDDLAQEVNHLDFAMFPIDPRLGKDYMLGAEQFLAAIDTKVIAPMHFQDNYEALDLFEEYAKTRDCQFFKPINRGSNIKS